MCVCDTYQEMTYAIRFIIITFRFRQKFIQSIQSDIKSTPPKSKLV